MLPTHFYYLDGESIKRLDSYEEWVQRKKQDGKKWVLLREKYLGFDIVTQFTGVDARETHPEEFGRCRSPVFWRSSAVKDNHLMLETFSSGSREVAEAVHLATKEVVYKYHQRNKE